MAEKTRYTDAELEEFRAIIMEKLELQTPIAEIRGWVFAGFCFSHQYDIWEINISQTIRKHFGKLPGLECCHNLNSKGKST